MRRRTRLLRLAGALGAQAVALAGLLSVNRPRRLPLPWSDFEVWIRTTPVEEAIAAAFGPDHTIAGTIWLLGSSLLYLVARATRIPMLIRSVEWMTLPVIRRAAERTLGTILVASTVAAVPVRADPPPPVAVIVEGVDLLLPPGVTERLPEAPRDLSFSEAPVVPSQPATGRDDPASSGETAPVEVVVEPGDNLWVMCRRHLAQHLGRRPAGEEIAPYWQRVIAHNRPHLISRNPDLIYAGEVIEMPPL